MRRKKVFDITCRLSCNQKWDKLPLRSFYFLHPLVMVLAGYFIVRWPLPVMLKIGLFALVSLASVWLISWLLSQISKSSTYPTVSLERNDHLEQKSIHQGLLLGRITANKTGL